MAVALYVASHRIVGWAMAHSLKTQLLLNAPNMAIRQHNLYPEINRSDTGSQYTSVAFALRYMKANVRPSMGALGDTHHNVVCESFSATLECALLDRRKFATNTEPRMAIFQFIEGW